MHFKIGIRGFCNRPSETRCFCKADYNNGTREIYELRAAIETFSAKRAFDMINEENIEWLKESVKKQKKFLEDEDYQSFM